MSFVDVVRTAPLILTEGAVVERLRRDPRASFHPALVHATFPGDPVNGPLLESIYREYLDIGRSANLPMLCLTPTWRANPERLRKAGMEANDVNGAACRFLLQIRDSYAANAFVGGLIGCRGDAYRPQDAMSATDAERFHAEQIEQLAMAGVDFLFASTLPAASEAIGIARALARMPLPYILSFVIQANGTLLDGTSLARVISEIDATVSPAPLGYMLNCVHHSNAAAVLRCIAEPARRRILGLQANTSARNHADLEGLSTLETEEPHVYADGMWALRREFQLKILGGCCGTDDRHIRAIACLATPDAI